MAKFKVEYESWVYNFTHHLATYEIEATDLAEAEAWAKNKLSEFGERQNAVLASVQEVVNA